MARRLSGDEQLMPIGRVLMINPQLLVLDEATEGLAPLIREDVWRCLTALKRTGQSILVIDKDIDARSRSRTTTTSSRARPHHLEPNVARACHRP
jgi:branched-chain amino acid transport system ATP-binding protein